jgi:hypothetical protein
MLVPASVSFFCTFSIRIGRNGSPLLITASVLVIAALSIATCLKSSVLRRVHRPDLAANGLQIAALW